MALLHEFRARRTVPAEKLCEVIVYWGGELTGAEPYVNIVATFFVSTWIFGPLDFSITITKELSALNRLEKS